jgi:two-component sensor histidine kinase
VRVPTRRGFGTRLIQRSLAADLGGKVGLEFRPEGVACTIDAPLPAG